MYRKEDYQRHKIGVLQKVNHTNSDLLDEISEKYRDVRLKFGIDDIAIKKLLQDYTFKEILSGQIVNGIVIPKDLYFLDYYRKE